MSSKTYIGRQLRQFDCADLFDGYSRVVLVVSGDVVCTAGTDTGRTLTLECPWGTQAMAENILASIQGFRYQPYAASDALLDPAAELGDGVTVHGVYSGIYSQDTIFGPLCAASVSAPHEEEIDHEYPYVPRQDRKITRELYNLSAELKVQAGLISLEASERKSDVESLNGLLKVQAGLISAEVNERKSDVESLNSTLSQQAGLIEAKVSKTGGDASSFGWALDTASWQIKANGSTVLNATKDGLEITGKITAKSGKIGGFDILSDCISYNNQTWGGAIAAGIYIGPSGIQLGKNFKVDASGSLTAASGTFSGNVRAGSIQYGGDYGTFSGSGITGHSIVGDQIGYNAISTSYTSSGINTSLGYADYANGAFLGYNQVGNLWTNKLKATGEVELLGYKIGCYAKTVATPSGGSETIYYLGYG